MKRRFRSVDEYIQAQPAGTQETLTRVRRAILRAAPDADESISYNMPAYRLRGQSLVQFAAWKTHYSLYASSASIEEEFKDELRGYAVDKGTVRFALSDPVPDALIQRIVAFRARKA